MADEADDGKLEVLLFELTGPTSSTVKAQIEPDGGLVLDGHDLGAAVEEHFGAADYEYITTLKPPDKDRLLLALVKDAFGGPDGMSRFWAYCKDRGIAYDLWTWQGH